ncbi:MAG TPA: cytochrome c [Opitutaceae bacterium]|jgi:mono/diheme cytochrome c family protein
MNVRWPIVLVFGCALAACDNMTHQDNARPLDGSDQFADGASARLPPAHTVPAGPLLPLEIATGRDRTGKWIGRIPVPITASLLARGRDRFNAACSECHGEDGYGTGIVVRRGFPRPPSYHEARLRAAPAGELFSAIVQGYGVMYPAVDRVPVEDRWAVIAYIRALQLSQHAALADVPAASRSALLRE